MVSSTGGLELFESLAAEYTMGESRSLVMYDIFVSSLNKRPIVPSLSLYATPYMDV